MGNGYGAIYGSTWWGSQNTINFNEISYYIYAVDELKTRALADGAIMEGFGCASESIRTMGERDSADIDIRDLRQASVFRWWFYGGESLYY
jgi:hypothetical protein